MDVNREVIEGRMNSSQKIVFEQLDHIWMKHVLTDYFEGNLTYGEQVVHASIAHHLRNHLRGLPKFRVWHEVRIDAINQSLKKTHRNDARRIDLVLAFADRKNLTEETEYGLVPLDLSDVTDVELFAAIEVKYASYTIRKLNRSIDDDITQLAGDIPKLDDDLKLLVADIAKLVIIRRDYLPTIHSVFVYIPGTEQTDKLDNYREIISTISKNNYVSFLFGHCLDSKEWSAEYNLQS